MAAAPVQTVRRQVLGKWIAVGTTSTLLALGIGFGVYKHVFYTEQSALVGERFNEGITARKALDVQRHLQQQFAESKDQKQIELLIRQYELKVRKSPLEAWWAMAWLHEQKGSMGLEQAIACYGEVIKCAPDFAPAYCARAHAYTTLGNYEQALSDYDKALTLEAGLAAAHQGKASVYERRAEYERALSEYAAALQSDSENEWIWKRRADIYLLLQQPDKALKDYNKALQINPYSEALWAARARLHAARLNYAYALADYERALALRPDDRTLEQSKRATEQLLLNSLPSGTVPKRPETFKSPSEQQLPVAVKEQPLALVKPDPIVQASSENKQPVSKETSVQPRDPFAEPAGTEGKEWSLMQKMHVEMHRFAWLLGRWEAETPLAGLEEWRLAGYQHLKSNLPDEGFDLEYMPEQQRVLLHWRWGGEGLRQTYALVSSDNGQFVFKQSDNPQFPDKISLQIRPTGGYALFVQNAKEFTPKQKQWLREHYQLLNNREAVRRCRPAPKGKL